MAPEICQDRAYGDKADVWSLGILLYEMCALEVPYNGRDLSRLVSKHPQPPCPPVTVSSHTASMQPHSPCAYSVTCVNSYN